MPETNSIEVSPELRASIDRITDALWQSIEDAEIAVSDGLHALTTSKLSGDRLSTAQSLLLLFRCLVNLRKRGFFTQEQDEFFTYLEESVKENRTLSNFSNVLASIAKRKHLSVDEARKLSAVERGNGDYITQSIVNNPRIADKKSELLEILDRYSADTREGAFTRLRVIGSSSVHGNEPTIDTQLLRQLQPIASASPRIWAVYRLIEIVYDGLFGTNDGWLSGIDAVVDIVRSYGSDGYLCAVVGNLSALCRSKGVTVPAIRLARLGLNVANQLGSNEQINHFHNLLIWSYDEVGLPQLAQELGLESEKRLKGQEPSIDRFNVYLVNGKILSRLGKFDESMKQRCMGLGSHTPPT